jgi:hypothetical protein
MTEKQKNRTPGYYWVRLGGWWILLWTGSVWVGMGDNNTTKKEDHFEEIDERKIERL